MGKDNLDIEFLISAFAYPFALMNETFYLRKRDLKVIGVAIFDHALFPGCEIDYDSGLSEVEENDIKEAIIANEKNYDTHIYIPRLTKEERFEVMQQFIASHPKYREKLIVNLKALIASTEDYDSNYFKKRVRPGVEMDYLTNDIDDEKLKSDWVNFYRMKTKILAVKWLEKQKEIIEQGK